MQPIEELEKRASDAGIRFLMAEIEVASSLLSRLERSPDSKERATCFREAMDRVGCAMRLANSVCLPGSEQPAISDRLKVLSDRLDQLSAVYSRASVSRARVR